MDSPEDDLSISPIMSLLYSVPLRLLRNNRSLLVELRLRSPLLLDYEYRDRVANMGSTV